MPNTFQLQKQNLVRDAIFAAAIDLFATRGFDDTTLEDISKAAGVSPRTLYRYFATRDELLAHPATGYGRRLVELVEDLPGKMKAAEAVRQVAVDATQWIISQPRMAEIIKISATHPSVRQAQQAVMVPIQADLAEAFAALSRNTTKDDLQPRIHASVTLLLVDRALQLWFQGDAKDASTAVNRVFAQLSRLICGS